MNQEISGGEIIRPVGSMDVERIIDEICDASTSKEATDNMDRLKKLLDLAEQYGDYAIQFCIAEARVYIRISEISDGEAELTKSKKSLIDWIRNKTADEMDEILAEVASGVRIVTIKNRETRAADEEEQRSSVVNEYHRIAASIVDSYETSGRTNITPSEFYDRWTLAAVPVDRATAKAYTEKTRDVILRRGGVGIADGMGTYVNPESSDRDEIASAVAERLTSIYRDMRALVEVCERANFSIPQKGLLMLREQMERLESL